MNEEERLTQFLVELAKLSRRYGLFIVGCGCCDSPRIENESGSDIFLHHLTYAPVDGIYASYADMDKTRGRVARNREKYGLRLDRAVPGEPGA